MRIAVVSDIHGNRRAFRAVLSDLKQTSPDLVVHGGDVAFGGLSSAEIIDEIRALGWAGVYGNADEILWSQNRLDEMTAASPQFASMFTALREMIPATLAMVGEERLKWLQRLPLRLPLEEFMLVHAGPDDVWRSPQADASDQELESTYGSLQARTVVYGHIHVPFVRRLPGFTVANTGSVSQSYDGDTRAAYLLIESEALQIRRVEYDVEAEAQELTRSALPYGEWLSRILLAGKFCPLEPQSQRGS